MTNKKKKLLTIVIVVVVVVIAIIIVATIKANSNKENTAEEIIDESSTTKPEGFVFYDKNGNQVSISNYGNLPMCLIFFSSDSENAVEVLNLVEQYYDEYKSEVVFLVIDTEESDPYIIDTMESIGYSFEVYYDTDNLVSEYYSYSKLPAILFLEEDGSKYNQFEGIIDEDTYIANLDLISGVEY